MLAVTMLVPPVDKTTPSGAKLNWDGDTVRVLEAVPYAVVNVMLCAPRETWEDAVTVAVIWVSVAEIMFMVNDELSLAMLPVVSRV